ncbi:uncharacterized protein LOC123322402 [Coccinella septempunctata]|uniref:uncharacterized protein LOC123322402 n=1 Tax=Coccinella septempunctata TaxID=41139 RepID=UPI001D07E388|nr:uncharacterized protein LOC123322402 [Coccinella septempunctata]
MTERAFNNLIHHNKSKLHSLKLKSTRIQRQKIDKLSKQDMSQSSSVFLKNGIKFKEPILNLSDTTFNESETKLLSLGLKFSFSNYNKSMITEKLVVAVETFLKSNRVINPHIIRSHIISILDKFKKSRIRTPKYIVDLKRNLTAISKKIKDNNLFFSKADKGDCLVVLNKTEYINKVHDFLSNNGFNKTTRSNVNKYNAKFKNKLSSLGPLLCNNWRSLMPMSFTTPGLYGLPKIHKEGIPIRPVVSFCGSLAYKLSKHLNKLLTSAINFKSEFSVDNSLDLISRIKDLRIPNNTILASFDVSNLFTTVPVPQTLQIFKNKLIDSSMSDDLTNCVFQLTELCLQQNFFNFEGEIFTQREGLSMGNCLSPLFAELFMSYFEKKLIFIPNNPFKDKILFWFRYVDDILIAWIGSEEELKEFHEWINKLHMNINFTLELESERRINFLDLSISRHLNKLTFSIYRKPSQTSTKINKTSCHYMGHKMAAFNTYITRLLNVPLSQDAYSEEVNTLRYLAGENGYHPDVIDRLIDRRRKKQGMKKPHLSTSDPSNNKYCCIPFYGGISHKIANVIRQIENSKVTFKSDNILSQFIIKNKSPIDNLDKPGVYRLECGEPGCNVVYVGRSGRSIRTRTREHLNSAKNPNNDKSIFGCHIREEGHRFDIEENTKLIHHCDFGYKQEILEEVEIFKHLKNTEYRTLNAMLTNNVKDTYKILD